MIKFNLFQAAMMALLPLIAMVTYQSINYVRILQFCRKLMFLKQIFFEIMIMNVLEINLFLMIISTVVLCVTQILLF